MVCSFITFRPCKYLDKKHTIVGRVVGSWTRCRASRRFVQNFSNIGFIILVELSSRNVEPVQEETGKDDEPINDVQFMRAEGRFSRFFHYFEGGFREE